MKRIGTCRGPDEDSASIRIRVLGDTLVQTPQGAVDRAWLSQRPGQLLRYLVCQHGRFVPSDQIVEALWPGSGSGADENVRYLVHLVRRRLEPGRPSRGASLSIECLGGAYALGHQVWVDARAFEDSVLDGLRASRNGDDEVAMAHLDRALALYRGDFLSDEPYAEWAMVERERLRAIAFDALKEATDICERRHELTRANEFARWLAELETYDSDVQMRVIDLCLRCGRRSEAARRYNAFRTRLLREFGVEPEFSLASLSGVDGPVGPPMISSKGSVERSVGTRR